MATGDSGAIVRFMLARDCVDRMREGASATEAARASCAELVRRAGSDVGACAIIACDRDGRLGVAHTKQEPEGVDFAHGAGSYRDEREVVIGSVHLEAGLDLMSALSR